MRKYWSTQDGSSSNCWLNSSIRYWYWSKTQNKLPIHLRQRIIYFGVRIRSKFDQINKYVWVTRAEKQLHIIYLLVVFVFVFFISVHGLPDFLLCTNLLASNTIAQNQTTWFTAALLVVPLNGDTCLSQVYNFNVRIFSSTK